MAHQIHLVVGDTLPARILYLRRGNRALDLSDASTVVLNFLTPDLVEVAKNCTIVDAEEGTVFFAFAASDVDVAGTGYGDVLITWDGGGLQHGAERIEFVIREEFEEG